MHTAHLEEFMKPKKIHNVLAIMKWLSLSHLCNFPLLMLLKLDNLAFQKYIVHFTPLFCYSFILFYFIFFKFKFIFKLYIIVLVLPNIKMNLPQVYMCSPSWTLLPPPSPYHSSGLSQCTSPKHPVSCIEPGLATHFIYDIIHGSMPQVFYLFIYFWLII